MKAEFTERSHRISRLEGPVTAIDSLGEGFINDTFIVRTAKQMPPTTSSSAKTRAIFPDVPAMMENIRQVTDHIRRRVAAAGGDPQTRGDDRGCDPATGSLYHVDAQGEYWAVSVFIERHDRLQQGRLPGTGPQGRRGHREVPVPAGRTSPSRWRRRSKGFHNIRHRFVTVGRGAGAATPQGA